MNNNLPTTVFVLSWITLLVVVAIGGGIWLYDKQKISHEIEMGEACIKHVHNMSASANANLKDIYSVDANGSSKTSVSGPEYVQWQATMQCLITYPAYDRQASSSLFNTTLK